MARIFNIPEERAKESYIYFITNNKQNTDINRQMPTGVKLIDPPVDSFDNILMKDFKYAHPKTRIASMVDMKNYDRVNVNHIIEKTK